jgi:hypothetical protein
MGSNITISGAPASSLQYRIGILWFSFPISATHRFYRGTTPVTVRASNSCGTVMRVFLVTVVDNEPPVIVCKPNATKAANGSGKYPVRGNEFNASASDGCGVSSLIYSLSGATVDGFDNNNRSLNNVRLNIGTTTITWRATDVNGNVSTCSTVVTVTGNPGFKSIEPLSVKVAPNPSPNYFTLIFKSQKPEKIKLNVVDVMGRSVEKLIDILPNGTVQIGGKYRPGIYMAEATQGKDAVVIKLIKE